MRYSAVRRQGFAPEASHDKQQQGPKELQVLDYTIQLHRLLPLVASSYAFHFTGRAMLDRLADLVSFLTHEQYVNLHGIGHRWRSAIV